MAVCVNGLGSYKKWKIGNDIRQILISDEDVYAHVADDIFPLVAPENTDGDFIVYQRQKYSIEMSKMGIYQDECIVAVVAISDNYDSAISLAEKIDSALTGQHTLQNGIKLSITLSDSTEIFEDDKYIESLIFSIK